MVEAFLQALAGFYRAHPLVLSGFVSVLGLSLIALVIGVVAHWPDKNGRDATVRSTVIAPSGTGSVIINGMKVDQLVIQMPAAPVAPASSSPPVRPSNSGAEPVILENGGFERGLEAWGTGFFEDHFPGRGTAALSFNDASAVWSVDSQRHHGGSTSLRVLHKSAYYPHRFSTFCQRVKVERQRDYRVRFWAFVGRVDGQGALSVRVLPSRATRDWEWDQFKNKVDLTRIGVWQELVQPFKSGADGFFDIRFAAEGPVEAWIDDVSVESMRE